MKVLVTGAAGFIGASLCSAMSSTGHTVVALSRDPDSARRRVAALSAALPWEPLTGPPPAEAFAGVDAVLHLAGESLKGRWTAAKRRAIRDSRVLGTRHLVQAIEKLAERPGVLLCASAAGYYGDRGEEELTEASSPGAGFLAEVAASWEQEASRARSLGLRVVHLRTAMVLGRGGGALAPLKLLFRFGVGGPFGGGRQWWPWVHQEDVTGLLPHALASGWDGPVNVTSPQPVRQREFARTLGRVLRRPALLPTPGFALRALAGEVATELLFSRRALPERAQAGGYRFRFSALEPALRDLLRR